MTATDDKNKLEALILLAVRDLGEDLGMPGLRQPNAETVLFGPGGELDSLGLVHLIAELEERVSETFDQDVIIADERAMSRSRSPFRSVGSLRDYLWELMNNEEA